MSNVLRWIGIVVGSLLVLLGVVIGVLALVANGRFNTIHDYTVSPLELSTEAEAIARGDYLSNAVMACSECHDTDLGGKEFINAQPIGRVMAPNLTSAGAGANYQSGADWVRYFRHGVRPDGTAVTQLMPIHYQTHISESDLTALASYLDSVPAVENDLPATEWAFFGRIIFGVFEYAGAPVNVLDHDAVAKSEPPTPVSPETGEYLMTIAACFECHGANLAGNQVDPNAPWAHNITPGGELGGWTEDQFVTVMREGKHPTGRDIDPFMPYETYRNMTDDDLASIWLYLQSLDPLPSNPQ